MKLKILFLILAGIILNLSLVSAMDVSTQTYYPLPAQAGDYFTLWLTITNSNEESSLENAAIKFKDSYPFSLDPTEQKEITIDKLAPKQSITKSFKVRVDQQAKEGDNNVVLQYKECPGCVWEEKTLSITVIEYQTMFDVVLQEITSDGVFIAIANIGKNPANAITVRIPEQEFFKTDLTSASIVGNLDSGDYTIVGFKISSKSDRTTFQQKQATQQNLTVQIDYTDPFGARRTVTKALALNPSLLTKSTTLQSKTTTTSSSFLSSTWFWIALVLFIVLLRKQIKKIFRKLIRK